MVNIGYFVSGNAGRKYANKFKSFGNGVYEFIRALGTVLSMVIVVVGQLFVGAANLGILCICICLPFMVLGLYLLMTRVQETKGADLTAIEAE